MRRQKIWFLVALLVLVLALTGCRIRTVASPELADTVLHTWEQSPQEEPDRSNQEEPQEPEREEPEQPEEPGIEEPAQEAETSRPEAVNLLSPRGAPQFQERTAIDLTVTYDANGGDAGPVSTVVRTGQPYGVQPETARRGYAFSGWWTAPAGGDQIFPETTVTLEAAHTLYAHWQEKRTCSVTFDGNGGRVKAKEARLELSDGDVFGAMPLPLREGYEFQGWFTAPEEGEPVDGDSRFSGTDDLTLYAHWVYNPYEFWSFTLRNRTQQIYLCQQASIYLELEQDHITRQNSSLVSATGSLNIAENRAEDATTDDWVLGKKPRVVVKCVSSMENAPSVQRTVEARFPEQEVLVVSSGALEGAGADALYAKLALAKYLYGDWYTDVDLNLVAEELGVSELPIYF